jgi:SpoVK/Ycf46/Vps4 family AAA+-type ATPase
MSTAATIIQLLRSHYASDERGFAAAALAIARSAKSSSVRQQLEGMVRTGTQRAGGSAKNTSSRGMSILRPVLPPSSSMLQELKPTTFADLLLPAGIQLLFDELVEELEYRDELAERGLRPRNRIILHGPPGNGKTSSAAAIASAINVPAYGVSLPKLIDKYIGGTGQNLGELFGSLGRDTLVVFDEIDAIGSTRGVADTGGAKEQNTSVNVLLTLLDRCERGIIVATTNRLDILDPALVRRFDETVLVPAPTEEQMGNLAAKLCEQYEVPLVDVSGSLNFDEVTKRVLREARRVAMRDIRAKRQIDGTEEEDRETDDE